MGVREQIIFPEIDYDAIDQVRGLDVTITTIGQDRRGGLRPAATSWACRSRREGAPGTATPRPRRPPRRSAARRRRAPKAEAEQAALEELKEENPEAYEKPTRPEEGEEGEEGEAAPAEETQE